MTDNSRATYRHGHLRAAAIAEALAVIAAEGESAMSVRGLATRLGVAHRALYNHFPDRDALLQEVAASGYNQLADALETAVSTTAFAKVYLRFALANRALYGLMMRQENGGTGYRPSMRVAVDRVIALSLAAWGDATLDEVGNRRRVMRQWMLLHGGLSLHFASALAPRSDDDFIAEMMAILTN